MKKITGKEAMTKALELVGAKSSTLILSCVAPGRRKQVDYFCFLGNYYKVHIDTNDIDNTYVSETTSAEIRKILDTMFDREPEFEFGGF